MILTGYEQGWPPVYYCSSSEHYRCISIPFNLSSRLKWESRDVYISLRPAYREGAICARTSISRHMASSPERPYQFTAAAVARWEKDYHIDLVHVQMLHLPWTGFPPAKLVFKSKVSRLGTGPWMVLALGRCTTPVPSDGSSGARSDPYIPHSSPPQPHLRDQLFAVLQHYPNDPRTDAHSLISDHSCEHDHLDLTRIPEFPTWVEWEIERGGCLGFKLKSRRSRGEAMGRMLEVTVVQ